MCLNLKIEMIKKYLIIFILLPIITLAQHSVKGNFTPLEDYKMAIIYKVTPKDAVYVAHTNVNENGSFEMVLDSTVSQGMYRMVYGVPQEENNFDFIYNAKEDIVFDFNSETGIEFKNSVENQLITSYTNSMGMVSQSIGMYFRQQLQDTTALETIFKTQLETQNQFEKTAKGTIALNFIKANKPYIPGEYEDIKTYINNLRIHYFDNVDFNSEILQSSNFLVERVLNFVFGMANSGYEEDEIYIKNIDEVAAILKPVNPTTKLYLFEVLWQQMVDANVETVASYIVDKYLMKGAKALKQKELIIELESYKRIALGSIAPDFAFEVEEKDAITQTELHKLDQAEQYVIVFWSSTCGHCLKELPQLHEMMQVYTKDQIQVIAIGLEEEQMRWKSETYNYPLFTHVLGLGKWDNKIGNSYNVTSTPAYFVLDKDKKILAKPYDFQAFKAFIAEQSIED